MRELMYVIATRGQHNKEIYLAVDEKRSAGAGTKIFYKWTEDVDEAIATFTITDAEEQAKRHFKNFNKWYIKRHFFTFK